jgi:hypothetical protein
MQATGVYWTALYDVLESYGFDVNAVQLGGRGNLREELVASHPYPLHPVVEVADWGQR